PATGPSRATKQGALRPAQAAQRVLRRFPCVGLQLAIERRTGQIIGKVADRRQADAGNHFQSLLVAVTGGTEISQGLVGYLTTSIDYGATEQSQCLQALVVDLIKATRTQGSQDFRVQLGFIGRNGSVTGHAEAATVSGASDQL